MTNGMIFKNFSRTLPKEFGLANPSFFFFKRSVALFQHAEMVEHLKEF